jgi:NAD(P)-dependent dehydrogenase (short-subunit alcohol dehydrogenase family)
MTLVVLTGATRGIGRAAAIALAGAGAELVLVGRDERRVRELAEQARAGGAEGAHEYVADLTLMAEVRTLALALRDRHAQIDVLANNAGALFGSRALTAEGLERTVALNHLAPFLLTNLLLDRLAGGRVITTSSDAHRGAALDFDDLQGERSYSPWRAYGTSKLCNILFTRELARRAPQLRANCFHPGVVRTGFAKNETGIWNALATLGGPFLRSPARGARSLVWLAVSEQAAGLSGNYVHDERVVTPTLAARDDDLARELWDRSAELTAVAA